MWVSTILGSLFSTMKLNMKQICFKYILTLTFLSVFYLTNNPERNCLSLGCVDRTKKNLISYKATIESDMGYKPRIYCHMVSQEILKLLRKKSLIHLENKVL
jgi:hypothetical protein